MLRASKDARMPTELDTNLSELKHVRMHQSLCPKMCICQKITSVQVEMRKCTHGFSKPIPSYTYAEGILVFVVELDAIPCHARAIQHVEYVVVVDCCCCLFENLQLTKCQ